MLREGTDERAKGQTTTPSEPSGLSSRNHGLAAKYAHEDSWRTKEENWTGLPPEKQGTDGGTDYDYGAADFGEEPGCNIFVFISNHQEGFSMFDTQRRVRLSTNWTAPGGSTVEECDIAYSMMETLRYGHGRAIPP
jgi:hypothetical protein